MSKETSLLRAWVGFDSCDRLVLDPKLTQALLAIVDYCWYLTEISEDASYLIDDLEIVDEMINLDYYNNKCGE